jgi:4'-phosphopantetheinyl transferase
MSNPWQALSTAPDLAADEVHVWRAALDVTDERVEVLTTFLNAAECERAERLVHDVHRQRFVVARGTMRHLIGQYLGVEPGAVEFNYGEYGKPFVEGEGLRFNISHSHELAFYAVAHEREVGIDVEHPRPKVAHDKIAERFFALEEIEALSELPEVERLAAFYNIWTRKEAYLKARGDGITAGLDTFSVSLGEKAELLRSDEGRAEVARWRLRALAPGSDYVAALCAEGAWQLRCFSWALR